MTSDFENDLGDFGGWGADAPETSEPAPDWNFDLGDNVGSREANDRQDVIKVETLLGNNDYLDLSETDGPTGYWGTRTEDAVKDYQKDNGLTVDGWLAPGGETITSLQNDLGDFLSRSKPATPEQVDDHHDRLDRGEDGALNLDRHDFELKSRDDLPELGAESEASNHRLAQAIHRSGDLGQVPTYIADAAQTDGAKAIAEAHDLMNRLGSERGRDLAQAVVAKLPPEHREAFVGGPVSERQPLGVGYDMLHKPTEEDIKKNPQLAGGLGGEIAGMKKDAEEAQSLAGGSGEDKLGAFDPPDWSNLEKPKGVSPTDWAEFKKALTADKALNDHERYAFLMTFGHEGGNKFDSDGRSVAGLTEETLAGLKLGETDPSKLTPAQRVEAYKRLADEALRNHGDLSPDRRSGMTLADLKDPKAAAQFFDTYFQHAPGTRGRIIQNGINQVIGDESSNLGKGGQLEALDVDGSIGQTTRKYIDMAIGQGDADKLRQNIADLREAHWRSRAVSEGRNPEYYLHGNNKHRIDATR